MSFNPRPISKARIREIDLRQSIPGPKRTMGIRTIMRERKLSYEEALRIQSKAIAKQNVGHQLS